MKALALAIVIAFSLCAPSAQALDPGASEAELNERATVIARVEVERVVCTGPTKREGDWKVTRYRATMRRVEAIKGEAPERFELLFAEVDSGDGIHRSITFELGWRGRVFLVGTAPDFALVEWNGAISDPGRPDGELPSCGGGCAGCALHPPHSTDPSAIALAAALMAIALRRRGCCAM